MSEPATEPPEVRLDRQTVWKVTHAANQHVGERTDVGKYPFSYRLDVLLRARTLFVQQNGVTWREAAERRTDPEGDGTVEPARIEGERTVRIDPGITDDLEAAVEDEYGREEVENHDLGSEVDLLAEAWNAYHRQTGQGWAST